MTIPIARPLFGDEELEAVRQPLRDGWVMQGPRVAEFERRFAAFIGAPHAAACSSGTAALHLAVAALGAGPGDEVLVPAFTWVSSANAVEAAGATPVFCDVELDTYATSAAGFEARVTQRTAGLMPVHLFGLCSGIEEIVAMARVLGLWVVEDAACAFGARSGGRHAGTFGDAGCFSFHPRKSISTGEGGMVVGPGDALDAKVRRLRNLGQSEFEELGMNYRMTDLQGAIGCVQMDRAAAILSARTARASRYDALLGSARGLRLPVTPAGCEHGWQSYVCRLEGDDPADCQRRRDALMTRLAERGIATRPGTHAPVLLPYYAKKYGLRAESFPNAVLAAHATIALPLYTQMTDGEQDQVAGELLKALP